MKAVVFHGVGDIRLDDVEVPKLQDDTDAIVRLTRNAICGTDLHMIRGTLSGMEPGTILGHEGVGVVEEVGANVRNLAPGDRVVIPSTIACGACAQCRAGIYAQCDVANPNGPQAGTAFFGGPKQSGPFHGLQAELARIPFANVGLVKLPDEVSDDQALLLSDIVPTAYFGAELVGIKPGDTVLVLGCGPVGQFAILCSFILGAGRVLAVDRVPSRLTLAREQGAEVIDFDVEDPLEAVRSLTSGAGADRVIDAVGVDAEPPTRGPAAEQAEEEAERHARQVEQVAPETNARGGLWRPGQAPAQALEWAVQAVAKAGTISVIGVYPPTLEAFPIGQAMFKNLTLRMGNCNHRRYIPHLVDMVRAGVFDPSEVLTHEEPLTDAVAAYEAFDQREEGWIKVELFPGQAALELGASRRAASRRLAEEARAARGPRAPRTPT